MLTKAQRDNGYPMSASMQVGILLHASRSSYLNLRFEMSADVYVRRPDLFEVMISPEESLNRFWGIELNPLLQTSPKIFVFVCRPAEKEVVDVHGKKQTFRREPVCRRVRRHLLAAEVRARRRNGESNRCRRPGRCARKLACGALLFASSVSKGLMWFDPNVFPAKCVAWWPCALDLESRCRLRLRVL